MFQALVLHAGTNNLPRETPATVVRRFDDLIRSIRDRAADIPIFVSAVLPRGVSCFTGARIDLGFLDRCNERAVAVNAELRTRRDISFIEHPRFGSDRRSANRFLLSRDGLHLTGDGVKQLGLDFSCALRSISRSASHAEMSAVTLPTALPPPVFKYHSQGSFCGLSESEWPSLPTTTSPHVKASPPVTLAKASVMKAEASPHAEVSPPVTLAKASVMKAEVSPRAEVSPPVTLAKASVMKAEASPRAEVSPPVTLAKASVMKAEASPRAEVSPPVALAKASVMKAEASPRAEVSPPVTLAKASVMKAEASPRAEVSPPVTLAKASVMKAEASPRAEVSPPVTLAKASVMKAEALTHASVSKYKTSPVGVAPASYVLNQSLRYAPQIPCRNKYEILAYVKPREDGNSNQNKSSGFTKILDETHSSSKYGLARQHNNLHKGSSSKSLSEIINSRTLVKSSSQNGGGFDEDTGNVIFRENVLEPLSLEYAIDILHQCEAGTLIGDVISTFGLMTVLKSILNLIHSYQKLNSELK